ncbi:MAG: hypothetical protein AB1407_05015 [Spirochaetota bacterium]
MKVKVTAVLLALVLVLGAGAPAHDNPGQRAHPMESFSRPPSPSMKKPRA